MFFVWKVDRICYFALAFTIFLYFHCNKSGFITPLNKLIGQNRIFSIIFPGKTYFRTKTVNAMPVNIYTMLIIANLINQFIFLINIK